MRFYPRRELTLSIAALGVVLVLMAFVAINLLERMTPALTAVLEENVQSMDAASNMLSSLAAAGLPEAEAAAARGRFLAALDDAGRNSTEPEEALLVEELRAVEAAAFRGEPFAVQRALRALDALGRINRAAAHRANDEARRLAGAGAWAVALLGVVGFGASVFVARRLARRLLLPLGELDRVLLAVERGDPLQRCATRGAPAGQRELLSRLNRLLDEGPQRVEPLGRDAASSSALLPWLLDTWGGPVVLIDADGEVLSASRQALDVLAGERGPSAREAMHAAARGEPSPGVSTLGRSARWALVALTPALDARAAGPEPVAEGQPPIG